MHLPTCPGIRSPPLKAPTQPTIIHQVHMQILAHTTCYFVFPQTQILKGRLECKWFIWCKGTLGGWGREEVKKEKPWWRCVSGPLMWGHRPSPPGPPAVNVQNVPEFSQLRAENLGGLPTPISYPGVLTQAGTSRPLRVYSPMARGIHQTSHYQKSLVEGENLTGLFSANHICNI